SDQQSIEAEWLRYLKRVNVPGVEPHIIKMLPANLATDVSIKTNEIYVEFDIPMSRNIVLITNCKDGICYKDAYWKTDKMLAVKVNLLPNHQYTVCLGDHEHGKFMSKVGVELPITAWSFHTCLE
ncbi:MAG TPA: Ig-like domain-containing protein, partial [Bacillota bacterium]|nr:Ig-like domain-containing protein [Bacillota bacterium]